jgi:DNA-directed RNA polymerase specialized sigma24 family protein
MDGYAYVLEALRSDDYRRLRAYAADGRSKFSTWLVVVARRLCLDLHLRRPRPSEVLSGRRRNRAFMSGLCPAAD